MRILFTVAAIAALFTGTGECAAQFTTTLHLPRTSDGEMARIINFDNQTVLDSLPIKNETVVFSSDRFEPCVVSVSVGPLNYGTFILSNDDITLDVNVEDITGGIRRTWKSYGGYNDSINALTDTVNEIGERYRAARTTAEKDSLYAAFNDLIMEQVRKNADNVLGYRLFLMGSENWSADQIKDLLQKSPSLGQYKRVNDVLAAKLTLQATQPGGIFKDFTVSYGGKEHRLSDVVGHGDYVLVDFWASWCGPCRAEMPHIKAAYEHFKGKNLKVIGVAVSDTPENSLDTAAKLGLPWEIWVNGGQDVLEAYNIRTIPLLILFGPDGKILERGIRGENIIPALEKYIK